MTKRLCLVLALVILTQVQARAHSTKGRIKIPLTKAVLEIDDIAYFTESYVHRVMYADRFEKAKKRFYVNTFLDIRQVGKKAVIRFRTLDFKEKKKFEDQITLHRADGGQWVLKRPGQEPVPVYTYVKKTGYYYQKYVVPVSWAGLALGLGVLGVLRFRKRGKTGHSRT